MNTNIIISGLGAIGGYYGGMLAAFTQQLRSLNTYFFMRTGAHLERVREKGLHLVSPSIDVYAQPTLATDDVACLPEADYLFLATKSYDALDNLDQLRSVITPRTIVVPLHNGLDVPPMIHDALPENLILPGVCHITARRTEGEITVRSDSNVLKFGTDTTLNARISADEYARAEWLYTLLLAAGVRCRLYREMASYLREKFLMLSPSALATTYYNMPIGRVQAEYEEEFRTLLSELASVYRAAGWEEDLLIEARGYDLVLKMPREATTSMHSDILAGHQSELESLVGYVIRLARHYGVAVPLYTKMYNTILESCKQ